MTAYRVEVRIVLTNEDTGRAVMSDTHDHHFEATQGSAHEPFYAVENAILEAMGTLAAALTKGPAR